MTTTVLIIIALLHMPAVWIIAGAAAVAALGIKETENE